MKRILFRTIPALFALALLVGCAGSLENNPQRLYQVSTINALLDGVYDGQVSVGELKQQGNFGLGTFNALDGEMLVYQGKCYQTRADGSVHLVDDETQTPFACVTRFAPETRKLFVSQQPADLKALQETIDKLIPTRNIFYAIRIEGRFDTVKTRSVPRQTPPYPPLVEVTKNQPEFEFENVHGVLAGFRCPPYVTGINVPGYHLHFLSEDRKGGGHLLDCRVSRATIQIDAIRDFHLSLPATAAFQKTDLTADRSHELEKVEK